MYKVILLVGLVLATLTFSSSVNAQTVETNAPSSIAFLDNRDLTVDFDWLKGETKPTLSVDIQNNDPSSSQNVTLYFIGLNTIDGKENSALDKLLPRTIGPVLVNAHDRTSFPLKFIIPSDNSSGLTAGKYEAEMVAVGDLGGIARRKLILQVKAPETPAAPASLPELVTLQGTKYLPTIFSFGHETVTLGSPWVAEYLGNSVSSANSTSSNNSTGSANSTIGAVAGSNGNLGILFFQDGKLELKDVRSAGKYDGNVNLTPNVGTTGKVKASVVVRDFWFYAIIAIGLGVFLGWLVMFLFKRQLPKLETNANSAELWHQIAEAESVFQGTWAGKPQSRYSMVLLAQQWIGDVNTELEKDAKTASDHLEKLKAYSAQFGNFQGSLHELDKSLSDLEAKLPENLDPVKRDAMPILVEAKRLSMGKIFALRLPQGLTAFEQEQIQIDVVDGKQLSDLTSSLSKTSDWAKVLSAAYPSIVEHLPRAREPLRRLIELRDKATGEDKKKAEELVQKAQELVQKLEQARITALEATSLDKVTEQLTAAHKITTEIETLEGTLPKQPAPGGESFLPQYKGEPTAKATPGLPKDLPQLTLSCRVASPDGTVTEQPSGECQGDSDDLFMFSANVTSLRGQPFSLYWTFSDDPKREPATVTDREDGGLEAVTRHHFSGGGVYKVMLGIEGHSLGTLKVTATQGRGRWERLVSKFRITQCQMTCVAAVLAIGSGFWSLYSSTWGTPADYLKAILWGSVLSEGLKYVKNIIDRVWAPT